MEKLFTYKIEEINDKELKIYGDYMVDTAIIIKKEWISWLINNIRNLTPYDFNIDYNAHVINFSDSRLSFWNELKERDLSVFLIRPKWNDKDKNAPAIRIPYPAPNEHLIMGYIEPLLCDLAMYLPKDEQEKLVKPWSCNMTFEEWENYKATGKKNESKINFIQEIDPKDYFG